MLKTFRYLIQILAIVSTAAATAAEAAPTPAAGTGYAAINGLQLYYEIHGAPGATPPLILLHGGLGSGDMFGANLELLAARRQVITIDLQAHGKTGDVARPLSFENLADDVAALAKHLKLGQVDVMGYSLGGVTALSVAIRHPKLVRQLVFASAAARRDGWHAEIRAGMAQVSAAAAEAMKPTPMYQAYARRAPRVADWPVLLDKLGALMRRDYDLSLGVAGLKIPVLVLVGDADAVSVAHAIEVFGLLGGGKRDAGWDGAGKVASQLAILPGLTHYDIFTSPRFAEAAVGFLDGAPRR